MIITYLQKTGWFIGLVLLQVLILNNVSIAGYATPFLYIYFIVKLENSISCNGLLLWAFFLGLAVDVFSDTPGMNAAATVFLGFVRPFLLRIFTPRDSQENMEPSIRSMGFGPYLKYVLSAVFVHHIALFSLLYFSFSDVPTLLVRIVASTVLTVTCILSIESIKK